MVRRLARAGYIRPSLLRSRCSNWRYAMPDTNEIWQWANLILPLFGGITALVVGVGAAGWILGIIIDLIRKR